MLLRGWNEGRSGRAVPVGLKLCSVGRERIFAVRQTLFRYVIECGVKSDIRKGVSEGLQSIRHGYLLVPDSAITPIQVNEAATRDRQHPGGLTSS